MLLFIALANGAGVVLGGPGYAQNPHGADAVLNVLLLTLVHSRAYPVFAVMFGYGLVQLARRQELAGATPSGVRRILLRRSFWLVVLGFLHAALLYYGDFLGAYGVIGAAAVVLLLPRSERVYRIPVWLWAATVLEIAALAGFAAWRLAQPVSAPAAVPGTPVASLTATSYWEAMLARLAEWPVHTATVLPMIIIVWLGMWAGRSRVLEDLGRHRRLLRGTAAAALAIAILGGLPFALASAGVIRTSAAGMDALFRLHAASGMFGGPGYAALAGLVALSASRRRALALATGPIRALGQRSLSGYLFQSVAWMGLFAPYSLALAGGAALPLALAVAVSALVWAASVFGAWILEGISHPGPAEALLRRMTYGAAPTGRNGSISPDLR